MRVLRCQVGQRNEDDGSCCREDELKAQLADAVNEIAVAHAVDEDEDIDGHHNTHTDVYGDAVANPYRINPWRNEHHNGHTGNNHDSHHA